MITKEMIKATDAADLRQALVEIQLELLRREIKSQTLVFDHTRSYSSIAMEERDKEEIRSLSRTGMSFHVQVNNDELQRQLATAGLKVKPYLNEDVHIESCPVIGKEPPIDFEGLEI